jgi:hypothetical protein
MAIINLIRGAWLDFKLRTCDPSAPFYGEMVLKRKELNDWSTVKILTVSKEFR